MGAAAKSKTVNLGYNPWKRPCKYMKTGATKGRYSEKDRGKTKTILETSRKKEAKYQVDATDNHAKLYAEGKATKRAFNGSYYVLGD